MPYIIRTPQGAVTGLSALPETYATEWLKEDDPAVIAYLQSSDPPTLSKVVILDRLNAAGKLEAAFTAMGGPGHYLYERWSAASEMIDTTNPLVNQVLDAIGADRAAILAPV